MTPEFATEMLKSLIMQAVTLAAPFLLASLVIGLCVSLFQAVTTIHEQTLSFVPKAIGILALLVVLLPWMLRTMIEYTISLVQRLPQMVQ